ncbi:MAG: 50S ribosomal protein L17 [Candidatus Dadabacteria bacterium]|nr:50S ribosomal protein L17 [Candidatus Dadabacteria bacterium]
MRNRRLGRKLGVKTKHRKAMFRNMATELFRHGGIQTTDARAKELKRVADKIITLAKNSAGEDAPDGGLSYKRRIFGYINDKEVARKVFTEIAGMHKERPGGYSRIVRLGFRRGDRTPVSRIELVTEEYKPSSKKKTQKKSNLPLPPSPEDEAKKEKEEALPETDSAVTEENAPKTPPEPSAAAPESAGESPDAPAEAAPEKQAEAAAEPEPETKPEN